MTCVHSRYGRVSFGLMLALLAGFLLFGPTQTVQARERGSGGGDRGVAGDREHGNRAPGRGEFRESRYRHNRIYPTHGHVVGALPHGHRAVAHGRSRYYFAGGVWYRPHGPRYVVATPPFGLFVPILPPYYTTVWVGGLPYYYANNVYYAHRGAGYAVVEPPTSDVSEAPPPADQMFIYPRLDQSSRQQADDRYECHRWAVSQTGFDPIQQQPGGPPEKRADYQRAMGACLDGRGYTVK